MGLFLVAIGLVLFASACGPYVAEPLHDVDKAMDIIWRDIYQMEIDPPEIQWKTGAELDCANSGYVLDGKCVDGTLFTPGYVAWIALPYAWKFHNISLAHELYHAKLWKETGDASTNHSDPGFGLDYGHEYGIVDAAKDALKAAGL